MENFFPGDAGGPFAIYLVKAAIQFLALGRRDGNRLRILGETLPNLVQEPQTLFLTKLGDINRGHAFSPAPQFPHVVHLRLSKEHAAAHER